MKMSRRRVNLQKSFAVFLVTAGTLLLLLSTTVVQNSGFEVMRSYVAEISQPQKGRFRQLQQSVVTFRNPNITLTKAQPVTDPAWMVRPMQLLQPLQTKRVHPFLQDYVIRNENLCSRPVDLVIVVHSSVTNFYIRRLLRETWAATDVVDGVRIVRVFFLGRHANATMQAFVNNEQATYGDLVQGDFLDAFANLTIKATTALRWVNDHCSNARFVLKVDDDVFVNIFSLLEHVLNLLAGARRTVVCHAKEANTSQIVRDPKSNWRVPDHILKGRTHWPAFCSGYIVVMTMDIVSPLYNASFRAPYVPVDDGYVYGILPEVLGKNSLHYKDMSLNLTLSEATLLQQYEKPNQPITKLAGAVQNADTLTRLWLALLKRLSPWAKSRAAISRVRKTMGPAEVLR